jgi:hypothetical protein
MAGRHFTQGKNKFGSKQMVFQKSAIQTANSAIKLLEPKFRPKIRKLGPSGH